MLHMISLFYNVYDSVTIKLLKNFFNDVFIMIDINQNLYKFITLRSEHEICSIR